MSGASTKLPTMATLDFSVTPNPNPVSDAKRAEILSNPGFGDYFTDHMVTIQYTEGLGWHDAAVVPYGPLSMDPASMVFHYGQAIFEGIKAYRHPDGSVATFRPGANAERFQRSAERLAMAQLPVELFEESLKQLLAVDEKWVPAAGSEASLYLRPFMIAREVGLGISASDTYTYLLIASPAGNYFASNKTVSVWLGQEYVRAAPGGTGAAKCAGNYAASLVADAEARANGCDQIVWLDAVDREHIEEMGGMNLFFVYGNSDDASDITLVTPSLSGSLLPGITRDSLLQVAQDLGMKIEERRITWQEWRDDVAAGKMTETFACGTAAVITPVGQLKWDGGSFAINDEKPGQWTMKLRETLTGIQRGIVEDKHGWTFQLTAAK